MAGVDTAKEFRGGGQPAYCAFDAECEAADHGGCHAPCHHGPEGYFHSGLAGLAAGVVVGI